MGRKLKHKVMKEVKWVKAVALEELGKLLVMIKDLGNRTKILN